MTAKTPCKKACCKCAKPAARKAAAKAELPRLAFIGMGIQSRTMLLPQFLAHPVVVATICDCDKSRREAGVKQVNDTYAKDEAKKAYVGVCKAEADFRNVIKDPSIDMVAITTTGTPTWPSRR